jgi:hypothetical protein
VILTAHQPCYLPWLGLLHKIALADRCCVLDSVQYEKNSFNNRNRIKTSSGPLWLTVPVESKNHLAKVLREMRVVNDGWPKKHFRSIDFAYRHAPYYRQYIEAVAEMLMGARYEYLADLSLATMRFGLAALGIDVPLVLASDYAFAGRKSDLILDMCRQLGATTFLFGSQGRDYADVESFRAASVELRFQNYRHPEYPQLHGAFIPGMSVLDLLFNVGPDSKRVLMAGNADRALDLPC